MYVSDLIVEFRVRFPGDKIFRLRLHQNLDPMDRDPESRSCGRSLCGMEVSRFNPRVFNNLGTSPSAKVQEERGPYLCDHPERWNHLERWTGSQDPTRWWPPSGGEKRVKCLMECFNETRSHGPVDQDFDVILIWRFYLLGIEPRIPRSDLIHTSVAERLLILALDRGIPGSIPGRLNLQIKITSIRWYIDTKPRACIELYTEIIIYF